MYVWQWSQQLYEIPLVHHAFRCRSGPSIPWSLPKHTASRHFPPITFFVSAAAVSFLTHDTIAVNKISLTRAISSSLDDLDNVWHCGTSDAVNRRGSKFLRPSAAAAIDLRMWLTGQWGAARKDGAYLFMSPSPAGDFWKWALLIAFATVVDGGLVKRILLSIRSW